MIYLKISLSDDNLDYIKNLALQRHNAKHSSFRNADAHMTESKGGDFAELYGVDKQYMSHFVGLVGEWAWSQYTGEPVDENIYAVRDGGEDFKGVEVKTITYKGPGEPELKITVKEYEARKPPKRYVLVKFDMDTSEVEILGKITRKTFDKHKVEKKYGRFMPENYVVPLSKMRKI